MANGRINNKEIYERIAKLEIRMDNICSEVKKISSNDLAHLEKKIDNNSDKIDTIERKLAYAAGALAILQVIVPFVIHYLFR